MTPEQDNEYTVGGDDATDAGAVADLPGLGADEGAAASDPPIRTDPDGTQYVDIPGTEFDLPIGFSPTQEAAPPAGAPWSLLDGPPGVPPPGIGTSVDPPPLEPLQNEEPPLPGWESVLPDLAPVFPVAEKPGGGFPRTLLTAGLGVCLVTVTIILVSRGGGDAPTTASPGNAVSGATEPSAVTADELHRNGQSFVKVCLANVDAGENPYVVEVTKPTGETIEATADVDADGNGRALVEVTGTGPGTYAVSVRSAGTGGEPLTTSTEFGDSEGTEECA